MELQQQVNMIRHDHISFHRYVGIEYGDISDGKVDNSAVCRKIYPNRRFLRADAIRPYELLTTDY